ncbi:hypothetical protein ACGFZQ_09380 [Streptomyces sp. NPDC048254]|uniref:hypothetical protein n=1 Tax=Streptomyces sp. NPDC048254 TaxID=3365525 RepID=UPI003724289D
MSSSIWKPAGVIALLVATIITATFLVMALWAARTRSPRRQYLEWPFSVHVVAASLLSVLIGAGATDRTPHFDMDELRTVSIPLTTGLSAHALVRTRLADNEGRQWPTRYVPAALSLLIGTLVAGATTYLDA